MAWLTTATATNKVGVSEESYPESFTVVFDGGSTSTRTVTTEKYKYTGMTEAAAKSNAATINDPSNDIYAGAKSDGKGGNWRIDVTETTATAWA